MPFRIRCPGCRALADIPDTMIGQKLRCKQCQTIFQVGKPPAAKPKVAEPPASPAKQKAVEPPASPAKPKAVEPPAPPAKRKAPPPAEEAVLVEPIDEVIDAELEDGLRTRPDRKPAQRPAPKVSAKPAPRRSEPLRRPESAPALKWVLGALAALLLVGGGVGLAILLLNRDEEKQTAKEEKEDGKGGDKEDDQPEDGGQDAVKPEAARQAIKPAPLDQDKVVRQLPGSVRDVAAGGAGRFLVLHLPQQRQLAVFDANEAKVTGYIPAAADNVLFAAGLDKLMVVLPDQNIVQRWDLHTLKREVATTLPGNGKCTHAVMGSASHGPLLLGTSEGRFRGGMTFLDISTCKPLELQREGNGLVGVGDGTFVRASADGRTFGLWRAHVSPQGIATLVLNGKEVKTHYQHDSAGHVIPGPDGKIVYTARGMYTSQVKAVGDAGARGSYCLPAHHGDFYLALPLGDPFEDRINRRRPPRKGTVTVHRAGETRPLITLNDIDLPRGINQWDRETLSTDRRIHFIPDAKLIVTIPETNDKLVLHRFDLDAALDKAGIDYLFVTSRPPSKVRKGSAFAYQVAVKSKQGGVKYKLDSGPAGMSVSSAGVVRWKVPADFAEGEANVILSVSDKSGQEVFHSFKVEIVAANAPAEDPMKVGEKPPKPDDPPVVAEKPPKPDDPPKDPPKDPPIKPDDPPAKPSVAVGAIKPPDLKGDKEERTLPAAIGDVCVGGGGRFLILHLASQNKLAVFDVNEAKVVKYLPAGDGHVKFAAGLDKLLVVLPDKKIIQRWSLTTFEREVATTLEVRDSVKLVCMGSASSGPLLIADAEGVSRSALTFVDIRTLKPLTIEGSARRGVHLGDGANLRASADGRVFGVWGTAHSPSGLETYVLTGNTMKSHYEHASVGHVIPSPDGKVIYTGAGLYTNEVKKLGGREVNSGTPLPAVHGHYYLRLDLGGFTPPGQGAKPVSVTIHLEGDSRPLVTLPSLEGLERPDPFKGSASLPLDKRVHFIPDANLIVVIPETADRLILRRFDVMQALEKSDVDYLFVASRPPTLAAKGVEYRYQVAVKSKKGGVKYKLDSAPKGMSVSPAGLVRWRVPADLADKETDVILSVSDKAGQEVFHSFKLGIVDKAELPKGEEPPVVAEKPPKPDDPPKDPPAKPDDPPAKPSVAVGAIKPPTLAQDRVERPLPAEIGDVCVGGSGRFLILHLPAQNKLAVFDVNEAKVVKYLPAGDGNLKITAGQDKLIVVLPDKNIIQRWSLATFEREVAATLAVKGPVKAVAMGSASRGLVLVCGADSQFLDPATLKTVEVSTEEGKLTNLPGDFLNASADGRVFAMREGVGSEPHTMRTVVLMGNRAKVHRSGDVPGSMLLPSPDGRFVYAESGVYTTELKLIHPKAPISQIVNPFLPAHHGVYFMRLEGERRSRRESTSTGKLTFYLSGSDRPLATLDGVEGYIGQPIAYGSAPDKLMHQKRIHYIPDAKLLITIPGTNDRLILRRFDIEKELEKSDLDYLLVTSRPSEIAGKGVEYRYQVVVKSNKGGVKYKLDSAPKGMSISPAGLIRWSVPADLADKETDILLSVSDKAGQEVFHSFKIGIVAKADLPKAEEPPAVGEKPPKPDGPPKEPPKDPPMKNSEPGDGDTQGGTFFGIKPPKLDGDRVERSLPSALSAVAVGGGGRYLILNLPRERKLAVFDVNEAKVVHYLAVADDNVLFAAGADKILVVLPDKKLIQRWSLTTGKRELSSPLRIGGTITRVCMGSGSNGPLLVVAGDDSRGTVAFFDIRSLRPVSRRFTGPGSLGLDKDSPVRASTDGLTFGTWNPGLSPQSITTLVLHGTEVQKYSEHDSAGHIVPGPDGKVIYTARGRFTDQVKPIGGDGKAVDYCLPAHHGDYFLSIKLGDRLRRSKNVLSVHLGGDKQPFATLPGIELPDDINAWDREAITTDQRVHLIPAAKLIMTIPVTNDKLVLHRFDPEEALEKSGLDYLIVTSQPPATVKRGTEFRYQVVVKSKKGGVKFKIESGPQGMIVSDKGLVTWTVPPTESLRAREVILRITGAGGQERFQTFKVNVQLQRRVSRESPAIPPRTSGMQK